VAIEVRILEITEGKKKKQNDRVAVNHLCSSGEYGIVGGFLSVFLLKWLPCYLFPPLGCT
jgi:hypothetical protein